MFLKGAELWLDEGFYGSIKAHPIWRKHRVMSPFGQVMELQLWAILKTRQGKKAAFELVHFLPSKLTIYSHTYFFSEIKRKKS